MQGVCGGDKALGAGPGEILEQEGGLRGLAWRGGGPGCVAVSDTHRWGELGRVVLGRLVLSIGCVWEEGEGVKLGVARGRGGPGGIPVSNAHGWGDIGRLVVR